MARILVVEDERVVAWNIQEILQIFDHEIVANIASAQDAIRLAGETQPDLVLMDIRLRGAMDGIAAAEVIWTQFNIPVVYLTAHADDQTLQQALVTAPFGYLLKPFSRLELQVTIETALRRFQVERELVATRQWLKTTLTSIGDATIATDRTGRITFMNPVAEELTGWHLSEVLGKPATEVLHFIDSETRQAIANPILLAIHTGQRTHLPDHCLLKIRDGAERTVGDSASPITDDNGKIIGGVLVLQDITERTQAEKNLIQSRDFYLTLFESFPALIWRSHEDGTFNYVNPAWLEFTGRSLTDELGTGWTTGIHPEDVAHRLNTATEAIATRQPFEVEYRLRHHSGDYHWVVDFGRPYTDLQGNFAGYVGSCYDISDRKQAEAALRQQVEREQLMAQMTQQIRRSLNLTDTLNTTVAEVRHLFQTDRVLIYRFDPDLKGTVIAESVGEGWLSLLDTVIIDECVRVELCIQAYGQGHIQNIADVQTAKLAPCYAELLSQLQVKANLVVPILHGEQVWGLIAVQHCSEPRQWQPSQIDLLKQLSNHVAIAIQQSELYQQLQVANQELQRLAMVDGLTQVANRRYFDDYLQQEWHRLKREQLPISLLLCDIDCFKNYNDRYGHQAGDLCLQTIALTLEQTAKRPADLVARYGGEEFAVILPNTDLEGSMHMAEEIQAAIAHLAIPHAASCINPSVTVSLGITSTVPSVDYTPEDLIAIADRALYTAKTEGRNRYHSLPLV